MYYRFFTGKPAKLSSVYDSIKFPASEAVDGIYTQNGIETSMAHSKKESRPWWRVDLVDIHCVWAVNILNRGNGALYEYLNCFIIKQILKTFIRIIYYLIIIVHILTLSKIQALGVNLSYVRTA